MKYFHYIFATFSLLIIFIFLPSITQARQVSDDIQIDINMQGISGQVDVICHSYFISSVRCRRGDRTGGYSTSNLNNFPFYWSQNGIIRTLEGTVRKDINLQKGNSTMNRDFGMRIGESVAMRLGNTTGSWSISGGSSGSWNMNGRREIVSISGELDENQRRVTLEGKVDSPQDNNSPRLSSSNNNIMRCDNTNCTAQSSGTATITASFPNEGSINTQFWLEVATRRGSGTTKLGGGNVSPVIKNDYFFNSRIDVSAEYRLPDIQWNVTVQPSPPPPPPPKSNPIVTCVAPFNIRETSADARWNYIDADGDRQTNANIEVATDPNFNNIVVNATADGDVFMSTVTELSPNTTYYTRVRVKNASEDWTAFNTCPGSFTTLAPNYPEPNVTFTLSKIGGESRNDENILEVNQDDQIRVNWTVTNTDGLNGCTINTNGGSSTLFSSTGFSGQLQTSAPRNPDDLNYIITLQCEGKQPAQINRGLIQRRNLRVLSFPVLSNCTIGGNRRSVSSSNSNIDVSLDVENTNSFYRWIFKRDRRDSTIYRNGRRDNPPNLDRLALLDISYAELGFGRYVPRVEVTNKYNRTSSIDCPPLVNLGNSTIREVSP